MTADDAHRGDVWTWAGKGEYAKPRPVLVVQSDRFPTDSVIVVLLTSDLTDAPLLRVRIAPSETNGLDRVSDVMVEKITVTDRARLHTRIGTLDETDMVKINRALVTVLGIAA